VLGAGFGIGWRKLQTQLEDQFSVIVDDEFAQRIVNAYREKYPAIVAFWGRLERLFRAGVERYAGPVGFTLGAPGFPLKVSVDPAWPAFVQLVLPSGRPVPYYRCTSSLQVPDRFNPGETKSNLGYYGRNVYKGGKWEMVPTYGGKLTENVVQAVARDVMAAAMLRLRQAGFHLGLTVHDEVVCEDEPERIHEFERLMKTPPGWAGGLPIEVEVYHTQRYRK
jgi:DNA polymerase